MRLGAFDNERWDAAIRIYEQIVGRLILGGGHVDVVVG